MEIEEAVSALIANISPLKESENVSLINATGRILGEDVFAGISVPSFPKSAMDGYAVRSSDIVGASPESPVNLEVLACIFAGDKIPSSLTGSEATPRKAVRIMTGAIVPPCFDTVVKQEDTDYGEETVSIFKEQKPYVNYCKTGEDIMQGSKVFGNGEFIGRNQAGILASIGKAEVNVLRRIRVSIISTGSEIVEVGKELGEAQIYNSIAYTLAASLNKPSFNVSFMSVADDKKAIEEAITEAAKNSDIIITTGGVSVGTKDLLPQVLDGIGATKLFAGVNVKPGSPTIGAVLNGKAILCLSGNPYAAVANFDLYVGYVVEAMTGCGAFAPVKEKAVLGTSYDKPSNVRRLVRANVSSGVVSILNKNQASSVLSSFIGANCYIDFPKGAAAKEGDMADIIKIPEALL